MSKTQKILFYMAAILLAAIITNEIINLIYSQL